MNIVRFLLINNFVVIFLLTTVRTKTSSLSTIAADMAENIHHTSNDIFNNINQQYNKQDNYDEFTTSYRTENDQCDILFSSQKSHYNNILTESEANTLIYKSIINLKINKDKYYKSLRLLNKFYYTQDHFQALLIALPLWKLDFFMDMLIAFEIRWTRKGFQKNYLKEEDLLVFKLMRPTKAKPDRRLIGDEEIKLFKQKFNQRLAYFNDYNNNNSLILFTEQIIIPPLFNSQLDTMNKHFFDGKHLFIEYKKKENNDDGQKKNQYITLEKKNDSFIQNNTIQCLKDNLIEKKVEYLKVNYDQNFKYNFIHQQIMNFAGYNIETERYTFNNFDTHTYQTYMAYNKEKKFFYNLQRRSSNQNSSAWYLYKINIRRKLRFQDFFLLHQLLYWITSMKYYDRPLLISHFFSFLCKSKIIFTYIILFFFKKHYGLTRIPKWFYSINFFETINFKNRLNSDGTAYQEDFLKIQSFLTRFCLSFPIVYYFIKNTIKGTAICSIFYNGILHILLETLWKNSDFLYYKWCAR